MHIRDAGRDDVQTILDIYNYAVLHTTATADDEPRTLIERQVWYDDRVRNGYPVLVVEETAGGPIIGWGSLSPYHSRVGYRRTTENSIYVSESHRGIGVGTALLSELIKRAEQLQMHAIVAAISGGNEASVRLHARFGFSECGRLPELIWKFGAWIDVVYMVRLLD